MQPSQQSTAPALMIRGRELHREERMRTERERQKQAWVVGARYSPGDDAEQGAGASCVLSPLPRQ